MALNYGILNKKKVISLKSTFDESQTVNCYDLLSKSITEFEAEDMPHIVVVSKEYTARPDLISLALYKSDTYADIICKINGISNPFELNEGMVIVCPSASNLISINSLATEENILVNNSEEDSILTTKANNKKAPNSKRSPIEATINDHNYMIYDDLKGLVFY